MKISLKSESLQVCYVVNGVACAFGSKYFTINKAPQNKEKRFFVFH